MSEATVKFALSLYAAANECSLDKAQEDFDKSNNPFFKEAVDVKKYLRQASMVENLLKQQIFGVANLEIQSRIKTLKEVYKKSLIKLASFNNGVEDISYKEGSESGISIIQSRISLMILEAEQELERITEGG